MVYLLDVALPRPSKNQRQENVPTHIFTPRTYQVEVLDQAIQRNTIVCLGNSSNRTFLTVMLIKELAFQVRPKLVQSIAIKAADCSSSTELVLHSASCNLPKPIKTSYCTISLVDSESQAEEHIKILTRHTDLQVLNVEDLDEDLDAEQWKKILEDHSILVMNGAMLLWLLQAGHCKMEWINLLVFDDCHLAIEEGHPYQAIMDLYRSCSQKPRILGLTYSILQSPCSTPLELEEHLSRLEGSLCSVAETATDVGELDFYGAKPTEHVLTCKTYQDAFGLRAEIESIIYTAVKFLEEATWKVELEEGMPDPVEECLEVLTEVYNVLLLIGPWGAGFVAQAMSKQLCKDELELNDDVMRIIRFCLARLKMIYLLIERFYEKDVQDIDDFLNLMSPKVLQLVEILHKYKPDDNFMIIGDDTMPMDFEDGEDSDDSFDLSGDEDDENKDKSKSKANVHYVAVKRLNLEEETKDKEENNLCGLVFVNRPHTALALNKLLQELCNWDSDLFFLQSHHLTWSDSLLPTLQLKHSKEVSLMHRRQEETLRKFRNREVNLLVAWSALQDGVDLPRCNLVVRFDLPDDYRAYVYSKGKAKAAKAQYYMLVNEETEADFGQSLDVIKGIENILAAKCQSSEAFEEIPEGENEYVDTLLPAYQPCPGDENAAKVTMSNAIGLVNRYCAKLPSDAFTHLTPKCCVDSIQDVDTVQYTATLQLPINSPIKQPITGDPMSSPRFAKMAVAWKTCQILHKQGELDNNLMPVGKEMVKYEDEEGEWEEHESQGQARPGTTKRKQYYNKKIAQPLLGQPVHDKECYLYIISMVLTCPITEEQNTRGRKIHAPEDTPRGFGIISEKLIPLVPQFPVFTRSGEVTISLDLVHNDLVLKEQELKRLIGFHHLVFAKVLRLEKDPMRFDFHNADSAYVIIPLNKGAKGEIIIDWDFIKTVEDNPVTERQWHSKDVKDKDAKSPKDPNKSPTDPKDKEKSNADKAKEKEKAKDRPMFVFEEKKFEDAVVMPSYRNIDQPQYFYVAEIRHDLTPKSPFPSPELYDTFQKYYSSKYGLGITNMKQPLLDVDHTSARLNLLTPRYMNQKGVALPTSSAETRRARRENLQQKQILVPELCDVHPFPASLWRKAVCLPAILYRVNCLLIADELRMTIAEGAHIGIVKLSPDFRFPQLEFGFSTKPSDIIKTDEESAESQGDQKLEGEVDKNLTKTVEKTDQDGKPRRRRHKRKAQHDNEKEKHEDQRNHVNEVLNDRVQDLLSEGKIDEVLLNAKNKVNNWEENHIEKPKNENEKWELDMGSLQQDKMMQQINKMMSGTGVTEDGGVRITELPDDIESGDPGLGAFQGPEDENLAEQPTIIYKPFNALDISDDVLKPDPMLSTPKSTSSYHTAEESLSPNSYCSMSPAHTPQKHNLEKWPNKHDVEDELVIDIFADGKTEISLTEKIQVGVTEESQAVVEVLNGMSEMDNVKTEELSENLEIPCAKSELFTKKTTVFIDSVMASSKSENTLPDGTTQDAEILKIDPSCSNSHPTSMADPTALVCDNHIEKNQDLHIFDCDKECSKDIAECLDKPADTGQLSTEDSSAVVQFDEDIDLEKFIGPSPCTILQTLTMSNANDFFNLERQETIGDSFLKFAITVYLYCTYPGIHEGKLSYLRSKQVSNYNLYKLGKKKSFPECMVASKFEPTENWLPPGYVVKKNNAYKGLSVLLAMAANMEKAEKKALGALDAKLESVDTQPTEHVPTEHSNTHSNDGTAQTNNQDKTSQDSQGSSSIEDLAEHKSQTLSITEGSTSELESNSEQKSDEPVVTIQHSDQLDSSQPQSLQPDSSQTEEHISTHQPQSIQPQNGQPESIQQQNNQPEHTQPPKSHNTNQSDNNEDTRQTNDQPIISNSHQETSKSEKQSASILVDNNHSNKQKETSYTDENKDGANARKESPNDVLDDEETQFEEELEAVIREEEEVVTETEEDLQCVIPYNLQTQHSLPDKSIADCVEALIGCYLTTCGQRAALQFMSWLGLKVLPRTKKDSTDKKKRVVAGYGYLVAPPSPLLSHVENASDVLYHHLDGYAAFEDTIQYHFKDKSYLLQAFTHASYHYNTVTDCYQRLEFLGDAILDYVITRHLYEDSKKHSPGILTDLRSALVNNNIFAALAVKWDFHKYFKAVSPQLFTVIEKFVAWQKDKGDEIDLDEEFEEEEEGETHQEREDIEIPKALGDIFESVAGAIYLDSGMSLDTVWQVYYRLMKPQIDAFTSKIPKSPVRELLEMEPETAKFEKPERTLDGKIRVTVNVVGKGRFHGVGRNYRIAKSAAAKRALKFIRMMQQQIDMYEMAMGAHEMAFGGPENMMFGGPESMMNFIEFDN